MITDCPHCLNKVLPAADGTCPSCRKNVNDTTGLDPNLTSVTIQTGDPLPHFCMLCGSANDRFQEVSHGASIKKHIGLNLLGILGAIFGGFGFIRIPGDEPSIILSVPICDLCAARGKVRPLEIDLGNSQMKFIAHKKFKEELKALRAK